ncbi:SLC13 family permease [uncultured Nitratireductor sp.]|uniref:SLC13 family permease n=1 Tax=uncultured Nitratireductor sp. TaxID=520953 RepID=UPI0025D87178|nr:SLC13 family permease [uncultured Nitratireductor sp.]
MSEQTLSPATGRSPAATQPGGEPARTTLKSIGIVVAAGAVGLLAALFVPAPMALAAALAVFCIGMWATAAAPEYWTALAFFLVAVLSGIAPPQTVFSGFYSSTFWLLFGGMILGASIRYTGLGARMAAALSGMLGKRYSTVVAGVTVFSLALAFVMPSSIGRIVLLLPIVIGLADHMGYGAGANGRTGMVLAAAFGTFLPAFTILPANAPNMIMAGMAETLYGERFSYWAYLLTHFPVLGLLKTWVLVVLIVKMFPDGDPQRPPDTGDKQADMSPAEKRLALVLAACLVLWLTDALHHVSPGWIALAAGLFCLWPASRLTSKKCINEEVNYASLFFVAGILGLGAVISSAGLGETVVERLSEHADFSADRPVWNVIMLTGISTLVAMITNLPGVPVVMTPMAENLSALTGLPLTTVLMTQVLAFSNVFLPYQAPPLITAMLLGGLPTGAVVRLCLVMFAIGALVLMPLDLLWWYALGMM